MAGWLINEWLIAKDYEINREAVLEFSWKSWGIPKNASVRTAAVLGIIWTSHLLTTSQMYYHKHNQFCQECPSPQAYQYVSFRGERKSFTQYRIGNTLVFWVMTPWWWRQQVPLNCQYLSPPLDYCIMIQHEWSQWIFTAGTIPSLGHHRCFFPNPFQFICQSSYPLTL